MKRKLGRLIAGVGVAALAALSGPAAAKEETGKILTSLVESVDTKLQALEGDMEKEAEKRKAEQDELGKVHQELKKATNDLDRVDAESTVIGHLAELNLIDRRQVKATLNTLVSVVGDLDRINGVLKEGQLAPERLKEQRQRICKAVQGVVPILESLKGLDNPQAKAQLATTKATVVMLVKQLQLAGTQNNGFLKQISETSETLQEVAVQLKIVNDLLETEREVLTVASHTQLAKLVLGRLSFSLNGRHDVVGAASKLQDGVLKRMTDFGQIWTSPNGGGLSLGGMTDSDEQVWADLVNGKVPKPE